jgi:hypothetical protein
MKTAFIGPWHLFVRETLFPLRFSLKDAPKEANGAAHAGASV